MDDAFTQEGSCKRSKIQAIKHIKVTTRYIVKKDAISL